MPVPSGRLRQMWAARLRNSLQLDGRPIVFDHRKLLDACPFLVRAQPGSEPTPPREPVREATPLRNGSAEHRDPVGQHSPYR